jgi:membrane protease YdiL (CAAX protease family)
VGLLAFVVLLVSGQSLDEAVATIDVTQEVTPFGLGMLNVVLALGIPIAFLVSWLLHRLKPRWLSSIGPRLRWRYLVACVGLAFVALIASVLVGVVVPQPEASAPMGDVNEFTTRTGYFLLVILLLTPWQAAAEEYVFRGYFTQAFGSLTADLWVSRCLAVGLPALLFAMAHGVQEPPVFFDRFAFGVVAGILVIATGGLEAAIAMHVLNNFFAFGIALMFGDMTETLNASMSTSYWMIASTMTQSLVYLALATWVARTMGLERRGPAVGTPELVAAAPRV